VDRLRRWWPFGFSYEFSKGVMMTREIAHALSHFRIRFFFRPAGIGCIVHSAIQPLRA
jgi:hypothetical protein